MTDRSILVEISEGIGWLPITGLESLNALNSTVLGELASALKELGQDETVKVVVITGAGEKAFVAHVRLLASTA